MAVRTRGELDTPHLIQSCSIEVASLEVEDIVMWSTRGGSNMNTWNELKRRSR